MYADLCRLESDVNTLVATLGTLAADPLLSESAHLREDREGILELMGTLAQVELQVVAAHASVTEAIEARRGPLDDMAEVLTLYRDVARAGRAVGEVTATIDRTRDNRALPTTPELADLVQVLDDLKARLARDGGIMAETERRIGNLLAGG